MRRCLLLIGLLILPLTTWAGQTILVFGDSLSAAYGIPREQGWVSLLEQKLADEKPGWHVFNTSISGETTSGGLSRILPALLEHRPDIVILELGANDGLRGLGVDVARRNLSAIIEACRKSRARVLLVGMRIPPNYGIKYSSDFRMMYVELANQYKLPLVPFLLEGVAGNPKLMQADGSGSFPPKQAFGVWDIGDTMMQLSSS